MMREIYLKHGLARRYERLANSEAFSVVRESGRAETSGETFHCYPIVSELEPPPVGDTDLGALVSGISRDVLEHAVVVEGSSLNHLVFPHDVEWADRSARMHVALVNAKQNLRCEVDLGSDRAASLPSGHLHETAKALEHAERLHEVRSAAIVLTEVVTAALARPLFHLLAIPDRALQHTLSFRQQAPEWSSRDGDGRDVEGVEFQPDGEETLRPPNRYRPSYRAPARRMPIHLLVSGGTAGSRAESGSVEAVAFCGGMTLSSEVVRLPLLFQSPSGSFAAMLTLETYRFLQGISVLESKQSWFPSDGGSWGGRWIVADAPLHPLRGIA